jgi:hypothetical protein
MGERHANQEESMAQVINDTETIQRREAEKREVDSTRSIVITFIVSCAVITLACVAALTVSVVAFFLNAPW